MSPFRFVCAAVLVFAMAGAASAQSGSVRGRVLDPQRVAVSKSTATSAARRTELLSAWGMSVLVKVTMWARAPGFACRS